MLILSLASAASYGIVARDQDRRIDEQLRTAVPIASRIAQFAAARATATNLPPVAADGPSPFDSVYVDFRDSAGRRISKPVTLSVDNQVQVSLTVKDPLGPATVSGRIFTLQDQRGDPFRAIYISSDARPGSDPTVTPPELAAVLGEGTVTQTRPDVKGVVLAISISDSVANLSRLRRIQFLTALSGSLLLGIASWLLVGLGLRPLRSIEDSAARIAEGDLTHRIELASDGTEVGRLGRSLNSMLSQIEGSQNQLRRFLSDASHELRTPLTSIRGYAELYESGIVRSGEGLDAALGRIHSESSRMARLVDDLLDVARLQRNPSLQRSTIDVAELLDGVVSDARVADPERTYEAITSGAVLVDADRDKITQVVANLVANAASHTPARTKVQLRADSQGDAVHLTIADNGPGIDQADRLNVFEPFFRSDPSRARESGGAGLGLAIVREIVRAHSGTVTVEETPGGGATFVVVLPRNEPSPKAAPKDELTR